jgi:flagella basal body P-ring formation protein FlgA
MPGDRETVGVMPSDRGTIQRGLASETQGQGAWPEATAPSSRRLPTVRRERKPVLAACALLLIIGGALAAGLLVVQSGKRVTAIEITRPVGAGQRIPSGAMQPVQVASGTGLDYVPWAQASQVARFYAATTIPPGTLLTSAMVARASAVTTGQDVLGLALSGGQLPAQLKAGDHVGIYAVSGQANGSAGCPGTAGDALTGDAVVVSVLTPGNASLAGSPGGTTDVTVAVSPADAGAVACDAAAGNVAVVVLPPAGAG